MMSRATAILLALALTSGAMADGQPPRVQWHATWAGAKAAAEKTGRPILFIAAAPQCHFVPGVW